MDPLDIKSDGSNKSGVKVGNYVIVKADNGRYAVYKIGSKIPVFSNLPSARSAITRIERRLR
jgi:hypothetical protein